MNSQRVTATTTAWMGGRLAAIAVAATTTTTVATVLWMWWKRSNSGRTIEKENDDIIYLDFNGTTPVYPVVLDAMLPFFRAHFGNPGSAHALGDVPKAAVDAARRQILTHVLGCRTTNTNNTDSAAIQGGADTETPVSACVFTASGTESDNLAIHWALQRFHQQQQHQQQEKNSTTNDTNLHLLPNIVTSNVEHPAMEVCFAAHERAGRCTVTRVPVGPDGRVAAKDMIAAIQQQTYVRAVVSWFVRLAMFFPIDVSLPLSLLIMAIVSLSVFASVCKFSWFCLGIQI